MQRKFVKDVVVEITTPMQRNFNVDFKSLRKIIEECLNNIKEHQQRHQLTHSQLESLNTKVNRTLKNLDCEKVGLGRELTRMQKIDRLKVAHANDSFYNPDTNTLLPSLDQVKAKFPGTFMT